MSDYMNNTAHKTQVESLNNDISSLRRDLDNGNVQLNKEKARNRTVNKHSEVSISVCSPFSDRVELPHYIILSIRVLIKCIGADLFYDLMPFLKK